MDTKIGRFAQEIFPGVCLCLAVTLAAKIFAAAEARLFGRDWIEALVIAILLGVAVRSLWQPPKSFGKGIGFSGKTLLEVAIVLLGASLSAGVAMSAGWQLLLGVAGAVFITILASFAIGRFLGLPPKLATLVACGNSICGNSAIAAAAPIINANGNDVAASISFTAVLGVVVVLSLPLLVSLLAMSGLQYGVLAGMTVYAIPQVLAATAPVSAVSVQIGTLVKLVRVLMLGPVLLVLGLVYGRAVGDKIKIKQLVPWFIIGFVAMAILRSLGAFPDHLIEMMAKVASMLTIVAMAALGLTVDVRTVANAGAKVTTTVILSLLILGLISFGMIHLLQIA